MAIAMTSEDKKWQAERDLETMVRAEQIEKDPKRKAAVKALVEEQLKSLNKVAVEMDGKND